MNPELSVWQIAMLILAGMVVGVVNVFAGGGSLLSLPLLLWMGLPAPVANASNRINLVMQNSSAMVAFARGRELPWVTTLALIACAAPGAALGAWMAVDIDETLFRHLLIAAMIFAMWSIARKRSSELVDASRMRPAHRIRLGLACGAMGFYAGFLQAGLGFVLIGALTSLGGFNLVRTNAIKVTIVWALQIVSLTVFSAHGHVHWIAGLALALGSATGAWVAAKWHLSSGDEWIRRIILVLLALCMLRLLWETFVS